MLWFWVGLFPVGGGIKPVSQSLRVGHMTGCPVATRWAVHGYLLFSRWVLGVSARRGFMELLSQSLCVQAHDGVSRCSPPGQSMASDFAAVGRSDLPPAAFLSVSCARSLRKGALPVRRFRRTLFPHGVAAAIRRPCRHRIGRLVQRFCRGNGAEQNLSGSAVNIDQPFSADRRTYQRA